MRPRGEGTWNGAGGVREGRRTGRVGAEERYVRDRESRIGFQLIYESRGKRNSIWMDRTIGLRGLKVY